MPSRAAMKLRMSNAPARRGRSDLGADSGLFSVMTAPSPEEDVQDDDKDERHSGQLGWVLPPRHAAALPPVEGGLGGQGVSQVTQLGLLLGLPGRLTTMLTA